MQVLEDVPENTTATTTFEVLTHDAELLEMIMQWSYPEREGAKFHTILVSSVKNIVKFILKIKLSTARGGGL